MSARDMRESSQERSELMGVFAPAVGVKGRVETGNSEGRA